MTRENTQVVNTENSKSTEVLGETIGNRLKGGEIIELAGDLGSGKTTFVRGLAKGLGSKDHVASPTFTISRLYKTDNFNLHHMDFYRLEDVGIMAHEIRDLVTDPRNIVVIEWADITRQVLPDDRLLINITATEDDGRRIVIQAPEKLNYLLGD